MVQKTRTTTRIIHSIFFTGLFLALVTGCSRSEPTDNTIGGSIPVLLEVDPAQASPGEEVVVQGTGFSIIPNENVVYLADTAAIATDFETTPDALQIRFTIPDTIAVGPTELLVMVEDNFSNSLPFEVIP